MTGRIAVLRQTTSWAIRRTCNLPVGGEGGLDSGKRFFKVCTPSVGGN